MPQTCDCQVYEVCPKCDPTKHAELLAAQESSTAHAQDEEGSLRVGDQPLPKTNSYTPIQDLVLTDMDQRPSGPWLNRYGGITLHPSTRLLVIEDMKQRKLVGLSRYGTLLQPDNGRDFLRDLYEELLDAGNYARGALFEQVNSIGRTAIRYEPLRRIYSDILDSLDVIRSAMFERDGK